MAKSYKRFPVVKQERVNKRVWNRRIRHRNIDYSLKGSQYKKLFVNYDTWHYRWTLDEAINESKYYDSIEDCIEYWKRCCLRK